ncbi:hypothetical protein ASA1KI_02080 [Opitutales bacterium ASA1]|uniref:small ribosomal subunit Rsm22 family protein n=1 Tax=Congregicoccus parvus TaxID=3081749 RepID=UPI002B2C13D0|nr:hypothetical protein ASA1KI_02080 [Opitutales bacterium ASA1]
MDWEQVDWSALERLRDVFLRRTESAGPYWETQDDLANYDFTFGRRIAWKWAAAMDELQTLGWTPPARTLVDWGCGAGIASRSVLAWHGAAAFDEVVLWDHSVQATRFATEAIRARGHEVPVVIGDPEVHLGDRPFVLVASHVLNELDPAGRDALVSLACRASAVVWLEPGTHADSHALLDARDELRKNLHLWAPCPHDGACGLRAEGNAHHWCHHFARPPTEAFTEAGWSEFSRRLGVDLRSLPYSWLAADRRPAPFAAGLHRILGRPRESTGVMRLLRCRSGDVSEVQLQKRDSRALWKAMEKGRHGGLHAWTENEAGRIVR